MGGENQAEVKAVLEMDREIGKERDQDGRDRTERHRAREIEREIGRQRHS